MLVANLAALVQKYQGDMNDAFVNACLELFSRVVSDTPVDTSRARQGWIPNGDPRIGETFEVLNNVAYIRVLEYDGHSQQAPQGMLRINTRSWPDIVKRHFS